MNKKLIIIASIVIIFGAGILVLFFRQKTFENKIIAEPTIIETINNQPFKNQINPTSTTTTDQSGVPLPSQEDIVQTFFNLINEGRIPDAVGMLSSKATSDESSRQAWGVQFNIFKQINLSKIESAEDNIFKVTLTVDLKPEAASIQPIPNYGWDNGKNIRWLKLEKENNLWKIDGIATGP